MRLYAIGDIHGQLSMLQAAHDRITADRATTGDQNAPVVHVGDLVDRGPDSAGVLQLLIDGIEGGAPWIVVKGNHDAMLEEFLENGDTDYPKSLSGMTWDNPRIGGLETLRSYGVSVGGMRGRVKMHRQAVDLVPAAHRRFLQSLPNLHATPELLFVHAGIRPGVSITAQEPQDLIWIREPFLSDRREYGPLIVHGHTPVDDVEHWGNRLNLDTGAGYGHPLSAVVIEGRDVWLLTETGRVPIVPKEVS